MAAIRRADVSWTGDLQSGSGKVWASSSEAFSALPVSWASRTETSNGQTSPEEMLAAAHASCYAMAFSGALARNGTPPEKLEVTVQVTADKLETGWTVQSSALTVEGVVPGISEDDFRSIAESSKDGCPISRAIKGNVELTVKASLVG